MPNHLLIVSLLAALLLFACSAEPDASEADEELPAPLEATVDLTIGVAEGEDPYMFGRVTGVTADREGRIYVADAQAHSVRVFSAEGQYLFSIGRQGEGPGEFNGPCCPAFDRNGRLWVRDLTNNRYNQYEISEQASFIRSVQMTHRMVGMAAPIAFDSEGRLIDVGASSLAGGRPQIVRAYLDDDGDVRQRLSVPHPAGEELGTHRVEVTMNGETGFVDVQQPFGPRHLVAHSFYGDWAHAIGSRYSIEWFDEDSTLVHTIERELQGPLLTVDEREQAEQRIANYARQSGVGRGDLPFGIPETHPPLAQLFFDTEGRLWAERSRLEGEDREADVYDRDGNLVMVVRWPEHVTLHTGMISGTVMQNEAYGILQRPDDVDRVVRLLF